MVVSAIFILADVIGHALETLDKHAYAMQPDFWVEQRNFAVKCLYRYATKIRRLGFAVVRRGRFRNVPKMKWTIPYGGPIEGNFVVFCSFRKTQCSSFYSMISNARRADVLRC